MSPRHRTAPERPWPAALLALAAVVPLHAADPAPVSFLDWGETTLLHAHRLDRPLFLYLDAFWCGECRSFEEEVLADPEVRRKLHEGFVAVRIDRDRQPDVFARYQMGGLPSVAFVLPSGNLMSFLDGEEVIPAGGTELSVEVLLPYLDLVRRHYVRSRGVMDQRAEALRAEEAKAPESGRDLDPDLVRLLANAILRSQDVEHGGVGGPVKIVSGAPVRAAMAHYALTGDPEHREFAERTLDAMAAGAVRDPLDGSFYRSTTTPDWAGPSPERLLRTQTDMLLTYLDGLRLFGEERYRGVADGLTDALLGAFFVPEHRAFRAARVAAHEAHGWTAERFRKALSRKQLAAARLRYGVEPGRDGPHFLRDARSPADVARELGADPRETEALLDEVRERLVEARAAAGERVDDVILTGANADAARALLEAWAVLGRTDARDAALTALEYLREQLSRRDGGIFHGMEVAPPRVVQGTLLADQIAVGRAWLRAYEATGDEEHRERGRRALEFVLENFQRPGGGLLDRLPLTTDAGEMLAPVQVLEDQAEAALAFFELSAMVPGNQAWKAARSVLRSVADEALALGLPAVSFARVLGRNFRFPHQVVVVEGEDEAGALAGELRLAAMAAAPLWKVVVTVRDAGEGSDFLRRYGILPGSGTAAYLLTGSSFRGPFRTPAEVGPGLRRPVESEAGS